MMGRRPKSVTTLAILGIILASFSSIGVIVQLISLGMKDPSGLDDELMSNPIFVGHAYAGLFISVAQAILLWIGSLGSMKLKMYGRNCMLLYAWIAGTCTLILRLTEQIYILPQVMMPALQRYARTMGGALPQGFEGGAYCGSIGGMLVILTFVVFVLVYFNKPRVVDVFKGIFTVPATGFPVANQQYYPGQVYPPLPPQQPPQGPYQGPYS